MGCDYDPIMEAKYAAMGAVQERSVDNVAIAMRDVTNWLRKNVNVWSYPGWSEFSIRDHISSVGHDLEDFSWGSDIERRESILTAIAHLAEVYAMLPKE